MSNLSNSNQFLAQQLIQLTELENLLNTERNILQQHNPDKLIAITNEKNNLLISIEDLDKQVSVNTQFLQEKSEGLHNEQIQQLTTLLLRCKDLNHVNGQIIQKSNLAVERMKTSLLESQNKSSLTYNSKGKTSGSLRSTGFKA